jgi:hypothetical protein
VPRRGLHRVPSRSYPAGEGLLRPCRTGIPQYVIIEPNPRRRRRTHGGGGGSPPRGQHRNEATTGLLRGYYESYYEATTRLLRGYYVATTGHYQATTRPLPGYHETTTRSRPRATRPAAQQRQHRSPAGAAHASNSEPTPTIRHTKGNISRRPFSTCRTSWTTLKTKHACDLLVQQDAAGVQPSLHSDLADEDEHVKRAGLGQVEHDGAVHDRQAPTPASSNHVACAGQHPVAP